MTAIKKSAKTFRVEPGETVDLKERPTRVDPVYSDKRDYQKLLDAHTERVADLQARLYASQSHALLIIFQGMDAAGKDGCIKHVMAGVNPLGCEAHAFSKPAPLELKHDFLWRTSRVLPERGRIGIFNRSYYEEVLVVRVRPELLAAQGVEVDGKDSRIWEERFHSIAAHEHHLAASGTRIVKFYLHVSKDEQRRRLIERIDRPEKNWKIEPSDIEERKFWKQYRKAYEECLSQTSTKDAPWYVIPADDKLSARLIVSQIVLGTLGDLDLKWPPTSLERKQELLAMRQQLEVE